MLSGADYYRNLTMLRRNKSVKIIYLFFTDQLLLPVLMSPLYYELIKYTINEKIPIDNFQSNKFKTRFNFIK